MTMYRNPEPEEAVWLCVQCNREFATNYSLRRHMRLIHHAPRTLIERGEDGVMRGTPVFDRNGRNRDS